MPKSQVPGVGGVGRGPLDGNLGPFFSSARIVSLVLVPVPSSNHQREHGSKGHRDSPLRSKGSCPSPDHRQSHGHTGTRVRAQSSFGGSCRVSPDPQQASTFRATYAGSVALPWSPALLGSAPGVSSRPTESVTRSENFEKVSWSCSSYGPACSTTSCSQRSNSFSRVRLRIGVLGP